MPSFYWWERRGQYILEATDPASGKRRKWYLGPEKDEAEAEYHRILYLLKRGELDSTPDKLLVVQLADQYVEWSYQNCAESTARTRKVYLAWLVGRYGHLPLSLLKVTHIERLKVERRRTNAARSVNHFVAIAKGMLSWAVRQGLIESNRLQYVQGVPVEARQSPVVSERRLRRALRVADTRAPLGDFMRVLVNTGMRPGELAALPWSVYDGEKFTVWRHKTAVRSGRPRIVPANTAVRRILERLPKDGEAIFSRRDGTAISQGAFTARLQKLRGKAPRTLRGVTFRALRPTFASRLAAAGVHPLVAQAILGHSSAAMTQYYTWMETAQLVAAAEKAMFP